MSERVNPPPSVTFPQRNPFDLRSKEGIFINQLIGALNSQRIIIEQLFRRSGSGEDLTSATTVRETYSWEVDQSVNDDLNALFNTQDQELSFNAITKATDYTLVSFDYVNFTANATATFPQYPRENDKVKIRKGGGSEVKLNGNGKSINGSTTGSLYKDETNITFTYFIDSDEWFAG